MADLPGISTDELAALRRWLAQDLADLLKDD